VVEWSRIVLFSLGCSLAACPGFGSDSSTSVALPAYSSDVKPILDGHCIKCHTLPPQNGAPTGFRLDVYDDAPGGQQPLGAFTMLCLIKSRAVDGVPSFMPPSGEPPLNADEKATLLGWADDGGIRDPGDPPLTPCP
jgi:hypothetical protein